MKKEISEFHTIEYPNYGLFRIRSGSNILKFRAESFLKKEPTTIEWLQSLEKESILIDVGANIGIYTIPAALYHVKKVIAIEPEIKNYTMLLDNLKLNNIPSSKCEALPVAISTKYNNSYTKLYITEDVAGASCHQIGRNQDFKLRELNKEREYRTVSCISLSKIVQQVAHEHDGPIHIKIDVDGIEGDVCQSLFEDKMYTRISTMQIELNQEIKEHNELIKDLECIGYKYDASQVNRAMRKEGAFKGYAEYVFKRSVNSDIFNFLPEKFGQWHRDNIYTDKIEFEQSERYFELGNVRVAELSRLPATYAIKDFHNHKETSRMFHKVVEKTLLEGREEFNFLRAHDKNVAEGSKLRYKINQRTIDELCPNYSKQLRNKIAKSLTATIAKIMSNAGNLYYNKEHINACRKNIKDVNIIIRTRHFVDISGFSLSRHHDSKDTMCAIIVPIFPYASTTSLITGSFFDRDFRKKIKTEQMKTDDFLGGNAYWGAFRSEKQNTMVYHYNRNHKKEGATEDYETLSTPYLFDEATLNGGEALVIPNPRCVLYGEKNNKNTDHLLRNVGHAVVPGVEEMYRPVLLIDYLVATKDRTKRMEKSDDLVVLSNSEELLDKVFG